MSGNCPETALINGPYPILDSEITGTAGSDYNHSLSMVRMTNEYPAVTDTFFWKTVDPAPPARIQVRFNLLENIVRFIELTV